MSKADILEDIEREFGLVSSASSIESRQSSFMSTGLLGVDMITGGGILPGLWYTVYGGEGAGKSTLVSHVMASATDITLKARERGEEGIAAASYDFEGSSDPGYQGSIVRSINPSLSADDIFGVRGTKGTWVKAPVFRLYTESIGDAFFDSMSAFAKRLPNKEYIDGKWWYSMEKNNENKAIVGDRIDRSMSSRYGRLFYPAPNGMPEAILICDSYPMMYPEDLDEGKGQGMAAVARMFSENIPKIAGRLRKKGITILGVNQLRLNPAARFGPPDYEPGGQAVRFVSSVRIKTSQLSVPHGSGAEEQERDPVSGGNDTYRYVRMNITKNKAFTGRQIFWQRLWTEDSYGEAHGFDTAWDTTEYLKVTNQAQFNGESGAGAKSFALRIVDAKDRPIFERKKVKVEDFKPLVLLRGDDLRAYAKDFGMNKEEWNFIKNGGLREHLFSQIRSGQAHTRFFNTKQGREAASAEPEENREEDMEEAKAKPSKKSSKSKGYNADEE